MAFKPGKSGNLNGRPQGSGHRQQLFNTLVAPHKEKLFQTAIDLALNGNEGMLRLFLERMLPAKPVHEPPAIEFTADKKQVAYVEICGYELIRAISEGTISPSDAVPLFKALESQSKLIQHGTMERQVRALEEKIKYSDVGYN